MAGQKPGPIIKLFAAMVTATLLTASISASSADSTGLAMLDDPVFKSSLAAAYEAMSPGDKSTLHAIANKPSASLMTTRGSPNDVFWTLLSSVGLSKPGTPNKELTEALPTIRMWEMTDDGAKVMPGLVRRLESN